MQDHNIVLMKRPQSNLEKKDNPSIRTDPSIFTSIVTLLLDRSNETSLNFSSAEIKKPLPTLLDSVSQIRLKFSSQF